MDEIWLVMTNAPDRKTARKIAALLVDRKLAACVNIVGACESVYRWEGKVETAREVQIQIKTMAECYAEVEATIQASHPYQLPEIVAWPLAAGLPTYLAWIRAETAVPRIA